MITNLIVLFLSIGFYGTLFTTYGQKKPEPLKGVQKPVLRCKPNSDVLYVRSRVLDDLAGVLNNSIPEYSAGGNRGFYNDDERGIGFFVVDLMNPTNKDLDMNDCVNFINGHIYHVAPSDSHYSLSHLVILEEGKLKVFRSVNCPSRGDRLEDAINYITTKLSQDKRRNEIIYRVRNYRKYGAYISLHHAASICNDPK